MKELITEYGSEILSSLKKIHSLDPPMTHSVHRGITPTSKTPPPPSFQAPPLNLQIVQAPFFSQSPHPLYWFFVNSHLKSRIFQ